MSSLTTILKKLCTPSKIYLCFSIVAVLFNLFNYSNILSFIRLCIISAFWTWNLQIICKAGYINMSWLLILFFTIITIKNLNYEPFTIPTGNLASKLGWKKGSHKSEASAYATGKGWQGKGSNVDNIYAHIPHINYSD